MDLLIAVNPDPDSRLPYLMRLPLGGGIVFRDVAAGQGAVLLPGLGRVVADRVALRFASTGASGRDGQVIAPANPQRERTLP